MRPSRRHIQNRLQLTLQQQRNKPTRTKIDTLHIDLPTPPPIVRITLGDFVPGLQVASIIAKDVQSTEDILDLTSGIRNAAVVCDIEFDGQDFGLGSTGLFGSFFGFLLDF